MGLWGKLFLAAFGLIAATVIVAYAFLSAQLTQRARDQLHEDLNVRASLVALQVRRSVERGGLTDWDELSDELGTTARARVTLIAPGGAVLGDSELTSEQLKTTPPHDERPEIEAALKHGRAEAERYSETLSSAMSYVAVRIDSGAVAAARVALPSAEVKELTDALQRVLTFGLFLALILAALLSSGAAQIATRAARTLTAAAQRMAEGDLEHRIQPTGSDELAELGRALDRLAANLSNTMRALTQERDRFGSILQNMQEGVLLLEANGEVALLNPAARELFMLNAEAAGRRLEEVCSNSQMLALVAKASRDRRVTSGEMELRSPAPRSLLVHVVPIAGGQHLVVLVDVTDLRRLEAVRKEFVSNASHELRTPITAILSAAETLVGVAIEDPKAAAPFQQMILRNAERLRNLVDDLLTLSRLEATGFTLELSPTEVSEVIRNAVAALRASAEAKGITIATRGLAPPSVAQAEPEALERVLLNLLENAIKYCPAGAQIEVLCQSTRSKISVVVQDNGPGIGEKHLQRVFERFYRVDAGRSRDIGGTGLGLSIVKHLVEGMGGTIQVASVVGSGTQFTVSLARVARRAGPETSVV